MKTRWKVLIGAAATAAATAYLTVPLVLRWQLERRAKEMGYELRVDTARLGVWKIYVRGAAVRGKVGEASAEGLEIAFDTGLRPTSVSAEGVRARLRREAEPRKQGTERELPAVRMKRAIIGLQEGNTDVEIDASEIARGPDGRIDIRADVLLKTPSLRAKAKGLTAKGLNPSSPSGLSADSLEVEAVEESAGKAGTAPPPAARAVPAASIQAKKASLKLRGRWAELEGAKISYEGRGKATVYADHARTEGAEADQLIVQVDKSEGQDARISATALDLETRSERLSKADFVARKVGLTGEVRWEDGDGRVHAALTLGSATVELEGAATATEAKLRAEMREVGCQDLLQSLPAELLPKLVPGTRMHGTVAWKLDVSVDLPARKKPSVQIWMKNRCVVDEVPEAMRIERIRKPFKREVYGPDGSPREVTSGPGSPGWTPLASVSPFLPAAIRTMEDPGFLSHRGFLIQAFENSIEQNIAEGRFVRGGSTVTMQLAKNLWLAREKTLSRKMQEAVMTMLLEQSFTKQQIMEYYVNCVEFGPDVYGVRQAAEHYFSKPPASLTLSQSLFLASILPNPKKSFFGADGKLAPGRLALVRRMMGVMYDRGLVTREQRDAGMREVPVLGDPSSSGEDESEVTYEGGIDPSEWK